MPDRSRRAGGPPAVTALLLAASAVASVGNMVLVVMSWGVPEAEAYYWRPAAIVNVTVWLTYALSGALLLTVYPTGRPPSRRWAIGIVVAITAMVLVIASAAPLWRFRADELRILADDTFPTGPLHDALLGVGVVLLLASVVVAALSLFVRWRRSRGVERLQIRWLTCAGAVVAVVSLATIRSSVLWAELLFLASLLAVPVAIGVAILRYRLYEIDRIISRTVTYAIVSAVLVAVYAALALAPAMLFDLRSDVLDAAATLAVAATAVPLHRRVQSVVDRRFNRSRYNTRRLAEGFGARVRDELDIADLLADLRGVIGATVQPAHVSLWLAGSAPGGRP